MMQRAAELLQKKRAIYFALLNYLNPKKASDATDIWLNEFSHKPAFELQSFISRITDDFNIIVSRKEIQQSIIKMLLTNSAEYKDVSFPNENVSSSVQDTKPQPSHIIFSSLITQWLNEVKISNSTIALNIKQYIYNNLIKLNLSFEKIINVKRWLNTNDKTNYIQDLDTEQMKNIFHFCYIGSCEYLGPVKTDKIISDIVKSLEQTPEATVFSPKNFF